MNRYFDRSDVIFFKITAVCAAIIIGFVMYHI